MSTPASSRWGDGVNAEAIEAWDAHHVVESPGELLKLLALP